MILHPNTFNNIDIKYRKYIIHSLINRKSIKFSVDSIICDCIEERKNMMNHEMNVKYSKYLFGEREMKVYIYLKGE